MKKFIYIPILLIFIITKPYFVHSQNIIDSLKQALSITKTDKEKSSIYADLGEYYISSNPDSSLKYSFLAYVLSENIKNDYHEAYLYKNIGTALIYKQEFDSSLYYFNKALSIVTKLDSINLKSELYNLIGFSYYYMGDFHKTQENWIQELELNYIIGNKRIIANNLNSLGVVYKNIDQYEDAIFYYQEAMKIEEERKDSSNIARALNNIGNIYFYNRKNFTQALDYYNKALNIYKICGPKENEADLLNNIGHIFNNQKKFQNALNNFNQAYKIFTDLNRTEKIAETQTFLGVLYAKLGNYQKATEFINQSYDFYSATGAKPKIAEILKSKGDIFLEWGKYPEALNSYFKSYDLSIELGSKSDIVELYHKISETYSKLNNYKKAFEYHTLSTDLNDSLFSEKVNKQIAEFQTLYETEKKDKEISLLNKDKALQDATVKRQKLAISFFIAGFIIISFFLVLILRLFRQKQKANKILEQKNEEISLQRDHIFQQNKEITDSIEYASRIQTALLPPQEMIDRILPDSFILFKPRDIVSGDYYWLSQKENKIISVTADCTGHGVPGAFMSMLGISFLNEIVNLSTTDELRADIILNNMRDLIISSLRQTGNIGESRDGMDMTICIFDYNTMELNFAGAYNPLYMIRNGELLETKPDKMPIGIHIKKVDNFTNHIIPIQKGDLIYTFSDGYVDQFGGPDNNKFRKSNFKELLLQIHSLPMVEQKAILAKRLADWMEGYEQVDDILVSGIRI